MFIYFKTHLLKSILIGLFCACQSSIWDCFFMSQPVGSTKLVHFSSIWSSEDEKVKLLSWPFFCWLCFFSMKTINGHVELCKNCTELFKQKTPAWEDGGRLAREASQPHSFLDFISGLAWGRGLAMLYTLGFRYVKGLNGINFPWCPEQ